MSGELFQFVIPGDAFGWLEVWLTFIFRRGGIVIVYALILALAAFLCCRGIRHQRLWQLFAGVMAGHTVGNWLGTVVMREDGVINISFSETITLLFLALGIYLVVKFEKAGKAIFGIYMTYPLFVSLLRVNTGGLLQAVAALAAAIAAGILCLKFSEKAFLVIAALTGGWAAAGRVVILISYLGIHISGWRGVIGLVFTAAGIALQMRLMDESGDGFFVP